MQAGELRHRLTILIKERDTTPDGQPTFKYIPIAKRWGALKPLRGWELTQAQAVEARHSHQGKMRYYRDLTPDMAIGFQRQVYEISAAWDVDNRKIQTEFQATVVRGANYDANATLLRFMNGAPVEFFNKTRAQLRAGYRFSNRRPVQFNRGDKLVSPPVEDAPVLFFNGEPICFFNGDRVNFFPRESRTAVRFAYGVSVQFFNKEPVEFFNQARLVTFFDGRELNFFNGEPVQFIENEK